MHLVERKLLVPYTAQQMFELVNNIEDYPNFLIWCKQAYINESHVNCLVATVVISKGLLRYSFTTKNTNREYDLITLELVNGPFKNLQGFWRFNETDNHKCIVEFTLEFAFSNSLISKMFGPIFHNIANTIVESFRKRAIEVYGKD